MPFQRDPGFVRNFMLHLAMAPIPHCRHRPCVLAVTVVAAAVMTPSTAPHFFAMGYRADAMIQDTVGGPAYSTERTSQPTMMMSEHAPEESFEGHGATSSYARSSASREQARELLAAGKVCQHLGDICDGHPKADREACDTLIRVCQMKPQVAAKLLAERPKQPEAISSEAADIRQLQNSDICYGFVQVCGLTGAVDEEACANLRDMCDSRNFVTVRRYMANPQNDISTSEMNEIRRAEEKRVAEAEAKRAQLVERFREGPVCKKLDAICEFEGVVDPEACASLEHACIRPRRAAIAAHTADFLPFAPAPRRSLEPARIAITKHRICRNLEETCAGKDVDEDVCASLRAACAGEQN
mmetsp:Transcript_76954/g.222478  ORF Transcript_76954/g.222478 Transcript_76954/m.222478 type:complete len:356 (-) Transcript_76954:54-1121(-)